MRLVLGIATVLGIVGPIAAFGLFYLGDRVFDLGHPRVQTLMYLMLSVAGHLTIFLTRTRGPFWSIRPARILLLAVIGTQMLATLIAVYGVFMTPLGWGWAALVWGYAIAWFLISDRVKLVAYRILDPASGRSPATADTPVTLAEATASHDRHIVPDPDGGWNVVAPHAARASGHFDTQAEAFDRARQIVGTLGGGEVITHGQDGKIRASTTID